MSTNGNSKPTQRLTLLAALLLGGGAGFVIQPRTSNQASRDPVTSSDRLDPSSIPSQKPALRHYFANCVNPDSSFSGFQNQAEQQRDFQRKAEQGNANQENRIAQLRQKFNQLKGTSKGATEIKWAKGITNWGMAPEGPEVYQRKRLASMLWLDEAPIAALTSRETPSTEDLLLFVEDHLPSEFFALEGLSEKITESLLEAFVKRNGGTVHTTPALRTEAEAFLKRR